jgi:hypothetical protein
VPNVSKQYAGHLRGEHLTTDVARWHGGVDGVRIEEALLLGLSFFH